MSSHGPQRNNSRTIFAWAMYDWANSAYITAGSLIFAVSFGDTILPEEGLSLFGTTVGPDAFFGIIVGVGPFLPFLAMPILGAIADFSNSKKGLLHAFTYDGATSPYCPPLPARRPRSRWGSGSVAVALRLDDSRGCLGRVLRLLLGVLEVQRDLRTVDLRGGRYRHRLHQARDPVLDLVLHHRWRTALRGRRRCRMRLQNQVGPR